MTRTVGLAATENRPASGSPPLDSKHNTLPLVAKLLAASKGKALTNPLLTVNPGIGKMFHKDQKLTANTYAHA